MSFCHWRLSEPDIGCWRLSQLGHRMLSDCPPSLSLNGDVHVSIVLYYVPLNGWLSWSGHFYYSLCCIFTTVFCVVICYGNWQLTNQQLEDIMRISESLSHDMSQVDTEKHVKETIQLQHTSHPTHLPSNTPPIPGPHSWTYTPVLTYTTTLWERFFLVEWPSMTGYHTQQERSRDNTHSSFRRPLGLVRDKSVQELETWDQESNTTIPLEVKNQTRPCVVTVRVIEKEK